jgi:hypothetical protein
VVPDLRCRSGLPAPVPELRPSKPNDPAISEKGEQQMSTEDPYVQANREYYNHTMLVRRVRVTWDIDVEWRPDDPGYTDGVIRTDSAPETGVSVLNPELVGAEFIGKPLRVDEVRGRS